VLVLGVDFLQALILRREPALRRDIDHQHRAAFEPLQGKWRTVDAREIKVVGSGHGVHRIWNSISSSPPMRSCSILNFARAGTWMRSPAIWMTNGSAFSRLSANRRSLATNCARG